jgi:hypothetical protein
MNLLTKEVCKLTSKNDKLLTRFLRFFAKFGWQSILSRESGRYLSANNIMLFFEIFELEISL